MKKTLHPYLSCGLSDGTPGRGLCFILYIESEWIKNGPDSRYRPVAEGSPSVCYTLLEWADLLAMSASSFSSSILVKEKFIHGHSWVGWEHPVTLPGNGGKSKKTIHKLWVAWLSMRASMSQPPTDFGQGPGSVLHALTQVSFTTGKAIWQRWDRTWAWNSFDRSWKQYSLCSGA